jgi:hypothetical protein
MKVVITPQHCHLAEDLGLKEILVETPFFETSSKLHGTS